jgi:uncharacterized protein YjbI with pentapeptide repeats
VGGNFCEADLRGASFKGLNLAGADFSNANICGANFSNANLAGTRFYNSRIFGTNFKEADLRDADFTRTEAGLQRHSSFQLIFFLTLLSAVAGLISAYVGYTVGPQFNTGIHSFFSFGIDSRETGKLIAAIGSSLVVLIFCVLSTRKSLGQTLWIGFVVLALINSPVSLLTGISVTAAGILVGAIIGVFVIVSAILVAEINVKFLPFIVTATVNNIIASATSLFVAKIRSENITIIPSERFSAIAGAGLLTGIAMILSTYIAWHTLAGDKKYSFVRELALAFVSKKGTNFEQANLTNADFTEAVLKNANFYDATITRTCWSRVKMLDRASVEKTILIHEDVRKLMITGQGENQSYIGRNLKGANLSAANLINADLTEADISNATLKNANLRGAFLNKTQALGADFRGANLTEACIEAWNIANSNLKCNKS